MATIYERFRRQLRLEGMFRLGRTGLATRKCGFAVRSSGEVDGDLLVSGEIEDDESFVVRLAMEDLVASVISGDPVIRDLDGKDADGDAVVIDEETRLKELWVEMEYGSSPFAGGIYVSEEMGVIIYSGFHGPGDVYHFHSAAGVLISELNYLEFGGLVSVPTKLKIHLVLKR